jgi:copper transport protein
MRRALLALVACAAFLGATGTAMAHPYITKSSPPAGATLDAAPDKVTISFDEPVDLLRGQDLDVVSSSGAPLSSGPGRVTSDKRVVEIPLRPGLPDGTYTVRYQVIGADSHVVPGYIVFGVGQPPGRPYYSGSGSGGPSETSAWGTSSRFLEIVGLGGLLGLLAFRWLVWAPALRRSPGTSVTERDTVLGWGRDTFWVGFGVLAVGAMLAEGYLLVVQSATVLGNGVLKTLGDATGISQVLSDTRFGSLVQLRGALLFALFSIGAFQFLREYGNQNSPRPPTAAGSRTAGIVMAALLLAVLGGIATQGHARVDTFPTLQVGAELIHIAAVSVWIAGLALVALVHLRLPKIAPGGGPAVAKAVLARFSKVALAAVGLAVLTGVIRAVGELNDPTDLWQSGFGRSILYKLALLCPIALLAFSNRRIVTALRSVKRPNRPTLVLVRRMAEVELVLSLAIVVVASVLAAQTPPIP